ncbi:hypothetical protein AMTRI_Chr13g83150 [Amborella trichopoda]
MGVNYDTPKLSLRPDIEIDDVEYAGKKSTRKDALGEEEEDWGLIPKRSKKEERDLSVSDDESDSERDTDGEDESEQDILQQDDEMQELQKEYDSIRDQQEDILEILKRNKDDDVLKGQAVKYQKALWDKALEIRILLQKAFSNSNRLPQEPLRSEFCNADEEVDQAYSELVTSTEKTIQCLLDLQEALIERNSSVSQKSRNGTKEVSCEDATTSDSTLQGVDETWSCVQRMHYRIAPFRDSSIDKWQRKTQMTTGAAAFKNKLRAFNQNISQQVSEHMRDPSRMISRMQLTRSSLNIFGKDAEGGANGKEEVLNADGDPELLDDSEFYQQLLKEFLESFDPRSSGANVNGLKRPQKKRKVVDRRASKSRRIRYNVHEKIQNFMAPMPMVLPDMAPKLFENLFGLQTVNSA